MLICAESAAVYYESGETLRTYESGGRNYMDVAKLTPTSSGSESTQPQEIDAGGTIIRVFERSYSEGFAVQTDVQGVYVVHQQEVACFLLAEHLKTGKLTSF